MIPMRTLIDLVPLEPVPSTVVFDWDAWGPAGSRFFSGAESRHMSLQFGWKIARPGPPDLSAAPLGTSREVGITVYDFNPLPFHEPSGVTKGDKRVPQEFEAGGGERSRMVVTSPSPNPEFVGLDGVQTFLPYRVTSASFEIRGRAANPVDYEISLGEDGMIVWTHVRPIPSHRAILQEMSANTSICSSSPSTMLCLLSDVWGAAQAPNTLDIPIRPMPESKYMISSS